MTWKGATPVPVSITCKLASPQTPTTVNNGIATDFARIRVFFTRIGYTMNQTSQLHLKVLDRFPEYRAEIVDTLAIKPDFRSLCQDYDDCVAALERFRQLSETLPGRVAEYERLQADLEAEIRRTLDDK